VVHKKHASKLFAITLQILTDFYNFCTKLTSNELGTSGYKNVSLHHACVSTYRAKSEYNAFSHEH